jgi:hypothetical protein
MYLSHAFVFIIYLIHSILLIYCVLLKRGLRVEYLHVIDMSLYGYNWMYLSHTFVFITYLIHSILLILLCLA